MDNNSIKTEVEVAVEVKKAFKYVARLKKTGHYFTGKNFEGKHLGEAEKFRSMCATPGGVEFMECIFDSAGNAVGIRELDAVRVEVQ